MVGAASHVDLSPCAYKRGNMVWIAGAPRSFRLAALLLTKGLAEADPGQRSICDKIVVYVVGLYSSTCKTNVRHLEFLLRARHRSIIDATEHAQLLDQSNHIPHSHSQRFYGKSNAGLETRKQTQNKQIKKKFLSGGIKTLPLTTGVFHFLNAINIFSHNHK